MIWNGHPRILAQINTHTHTHTHTHSLKLYYLCPFYQLISSFNRLDGSKREHERPIDWTIWSSMLLEAMTSDVIASSPWKIFGFQNGKTFFHICTFKAYMCMFWIFITYCRITAFQRSKRLGFLWEGELLFWFTSSWLF